MSVSSINSGIATTQQTVQNGVASSRAVRPDAQSEGAGNTESQNQVADLLPPNYGTSGPLFNLVGVAAYKAIMNPQASTSLWFEA